MGKNVDYSEQKSIILDINNELVFAYNSLANSARIAKYVYDLSQHQWIYLIADGSGIGKANSLIYIAST